MIFCRREPKAEFPWEGNGKKLIRTGISLPDGIRAAKISIIYDCSNMKADSCFEVIIQSFDPIIGSQLK